jgi:release factor glutamine methyltransferase
VALLPDPGPAFWRLVAARTRRVPLQHLTGTAPFRHVELLVGPGVFVPRPETELVAGIAIDHARRAAPGGGRAPVVVDLGTGSGAIARAVADEVPHAEVHAVELDPVAARWAERNLVGTGVRLHRGDLADPATLPASLRVQVDVVVSNPPYIPPDAVPADPEVREHDPALALYGGGPDGLDAVRAVAATAAVLLRPGGWAVLEHGERQGEAVAAILGEAGLGDGATHLDLSGRPRCTTGRLPLVAVGGPTIAGDDGEAGGPG